MTEDPKQLITEIVNAGATAGVLARCLYVSESAVSCWRRGRRTPSRWHVLELQRLHRLVGASVGMAATGEAVVIPTGTRSAA